MHKNNFLFIDWISPPNHNGFNQAFFDTIDVKNADNQVTNKQVTNVVKCHVNNLHGFKGWIDLLEDEKKRFY